MTADLRFARATEQLTIHKIIHRCGHRVSLRPYSLPVLSGPIEEVLAHEAFLKSILCPACRDKEGAL